MRKAIVMAVLFVVGSSFLAACAGTGAEALTGTTWYLVSGGEGSPAWRWTVPPDAQSQYTIRFEKDGTFASRADCNRLSGSWEARGSDRLTVTPGPMTMAFCGEMSFDILYAGLLGQVRAWNVASTGLSLTLGDGGRLDYTSMAPPIPSPSDEQTQTPTPAPAPAPTTTVTATATATATATVTATPTASASASRPTASATASAPPRPTPTSPPKPSPTPKPSPEPKPTATPTAPAGPSLTGRSWHLVAFALRTPQFEGSVPADQQSKYTLELRADGTFTAQADCNTVHGTYAPAETSAGHGDLTLTPGPATVKACDEGSYGDLYLTAIGNTVSFSITGEHLSLGLADSGTLQYQ